MKYILSEKILGYEGKPVKEGDKELDWKDVVFSACNSRALEANGKPEPEMTMEDKQKAYQMTKKSFEVKEGEEVDFSADWVAFLLKRIGKIYQPLIVGRATEFFEKK